MKLPLKLLLLPSLDALWQSYDLQPIAKPLEHMPIESPNIKSVHKPKSSQNHKLYVFVLELVTMVNAASTNLVVAGPIIDASTINSPAIYNLGINHHLMHLSIIVISDHLLTTILTTTLASLLG